MDSHRPRGLTNGFLPEAAFLHLEPTATGFVDLDGPPAVRHAGGGDWGAGCRDALLLVRLHEEPLGIVYVDGPLDRLTPDLLAAAIWHNCAGEIDAHCRRFGCHAGELSQTSLLAGLAAPAGGCAGAHAPDLATTVTVVIPTGGRPEKLRRCLEGMAHLRYRSFDIVVVDNRPESPGTEDVVRAFTDRLAVRYQAEPRRGSSVARNRGAAATSAELVVFSDDDVVVDPGWLSWLTRPFAEPSVTAVAGMILPLELQTESQKRLEQYAGFSKGVVRTEYDLTAHRADDRVLFPYWGGMFGSGASMAFRRSELVGFGGFDTALGAGSPARAGADIEAFTAAILAGGRVVYEPRAVSWHEHIRDPGALRRQLLDYGVGFAAIMTKYMLRDVRFLRAVTRSVPLLLTKRREEQHEHPSRLPRELRRAERRGMLLGPWLYARSLLWARRRRLADVIHAG